MNHDAYAALRIPKFRLFLTFRLALTIAIQIQGVIVGWQIYELTKDPLSLGLIGLAEALPAISVSLHGGQMADRANRKHIILACMAALILMSLCLFVYSWNMSRFYTTAGVFPIYMCIFGIGLARGILSPALFAFYTNTVPSPLFPNASAWNSSIWHLGSITGPAIGGLSYGFLGGTFTYACVLLLIVFATFFISLIENTPVSQNSDITRQDRSLWTGVQFVFRNQQLLGALSLDLFAVLFGGAVALLPIFAGDILKVGAQGLGLLRAAPAVGAVLMGIFLAHAPLRRHVGYKLLAAVAGFGLCMIAFGLSQNFWLSIAILALSGAFDNISVVTRSLIVQTHTPDHMRGRVAAVNQIFIGSSNEIGAFESGVAARLLGVIPSVIFGGCMTLVTVFGTAFFVPKLRQLDEIK